jgi:hypothetical protein
VIRLAALALLALAGPALADIIPDGVVPVSHEIRIEQARDFGVTLVVFPTDASAPWQQEKHEVGIAVVTSGGAMPAFGKWRAPSLWAVTGALPEDPKTVSREWLKAHGVECGSAIERLRYVPEEEGVASIVTVYRVVEVSPQGVRLEGVAETRLGEDGAVKSKGVPAVKPAADRRSGSAPPRDPARSPAVAFGVAGVALGLLVLRRRPS